MNKKAFIGVTLITATVVGGVVYFRHKILEQIDKFLDSDLPEPVDLSREERRLINEALQQEHPDLFDEHGRLRKPDLE